MCVRACVCVRTHALSNVHAYKPGQDRLNTDITCEKAQMDAKTHTNTCVRSDVNQLCSKNTPQTGYCEIAV